MTKLFPYFDVSDFRIYENRSEHFIPYSNADFDECPLCKAPIAKQDLRQTVDTADYELKLSEVNQSLKCFSLVSCSLCGWWQVRRFVNDHEDRNHGEAAYISSIVKQFDVSSYNAPLVALAHHLRIVSDDIFDVHFSKMEELVGAVLREHIDCEVVHCGRSGDRGIDLLLVLSNEVIPVQVKRRIHPGALEPVSTVREMLGVMFRDHYKKAILVTTAERYSKSGQRDVMDVLSSGTADQIELIDRARFASLLRQYFRVPALPWIEEAKALATAPYKYCFSGSFDLCQHRIDERQRSTHVWRSFLERLRSSGRSAALAELRSELKRNNMWDDAFHLLLAQSVPEHCSLDALRFAVHSEEAADNRARQAYDTWKSSARSDELSPHALRFLSAATRLGSSSLDPDRLSDTDPPAQ
jgi:hypothetical protein